MIHWSGRYSLPERRIFFTGIVFRIKGSTDLAGQLIIDAEKEGLRNLCREQNLAPAVPMVSLKKHAYFFDLSLSWTNFPLPINE